jgi:aminodeoxyfutalosine synthase
MEMISETEAQELLGSRDLIAIGMKADEVRRRLHGARTTFVRVFEIHVDAPVTSLPARTSAGEFRIVGSASSLEAAIVAVRGGRNLAAGAPLLGFSLADLVTLEGAASLAGVLTALREAGLEGISEAPLDLLDNAEAAIAAARGAGLSVTRLTINVQRLDDRIALAHRARALQSKLGGFHAFAPLPRTISISAPTTGYDDVKQVALTRLVADNIPSIQVDWQLYGPKLAQFALTIGADDVDGVAAVDPGILGTRRSPIEEIRGNIRAAGLEPVERNARFEAIG